MTDESIGLAALRRSTALPEGQTNKPSDEDDPEQVDGSNPLPGERISDVHGLVR